MSYSKIGNCPRCGAGIFTPDPWNGVMPPPSTFTCNCVKAGVYTPSATNPKEQDNTTTPTIANNLGHNLELKELFAAIDKLIKRQDKIESLLLELLDKKKKTTLHD